MTCVFNISKMLVIAVAGKVCHTVVHISPANCTDPLCPVFPACLVCQNAADFDDDTCLDLKRGFNISFKQMKSQWSKAYNGTRTI